MNNRIHIQVGAEGELGTSTAIIATGTMAQLSVSRLDEVRTQTLARLTRVRLTHPYEQQWGSDEWGRRRREQEKIKLPARQPHFWRRGSHRSSSHICGWPVI